MLFYSLGIHIYGFVIRLAAIFHPKAAAWVKGRKHWKQDEKLKQLNGCIWMHCASLGEFEQGRPVLEMLKSKYPKRKILLTFFSPSGYEIQKQYAFADYVTYLPLDTKSNANYLINLVNPAMAIFVKYDIWPHFMHALHTNKIPAFLISASFRPNHWFFKPWNAWFRKLLNHFSHIFVQDQSSEVLLHQHQIHQVSIAGDTRIDRVIAIKNQSFSDSKIESFIQQFPVVIAGSTWEADERLIAKAIPQLPLNYRYIIVPHDVSESHIQTMRKIFSIPFALYSDDTLDTTTRILVIDKIGLLNKIYRYASCTYVGGGFGKSIHNILEPAVYNKPVLFGPNHHKFPEAKWLRECGLGFEIKSSDDMIDLLSKPFSNSGSDTVPDCILQRSGGSKIVVNKLEEFLFSDSF